MDMAGVDTTDGAEATGLDITTDIGTDTGLAETTTTIIIAMTIITRTHTDPELPLVPAMDPEVETEPEITAPILITTPTTT
jgi:hypothetical protein